MELDDLSPTNRYKLLKLLGGECRICPITEIKDLEVDHIFNDGAQERTKYGSPEKIYGWYLENPDQAFRRLQPLCKVHHDEKHFVIKFQEDFFHQGIEQKVELGVLQGKPRSEVSRMELFMDILKGLEGNPKIPVEETVFVKELEKSEKFPDDEPRKYIRRMLREASIYESRPGAYNRV